MRDRDIRDELRRALLALHAGDADTVVIEELGVLQGDARVDLAVVNGQLHGFEIKSEADTLARLPGQVTAYSRVFDRVTLVLSGRHTERAAAMAPPWWGIVCASPVRENVELTDVREASINPEVRARDLAELLWRDEVLTMLEDRGAAKGLRSKPRWVLWDRLCEVYTTEEIAAAVRFRLKQRASRTAART